MRIDLARTDADILACFPVMVELRPHIVREEFVATIRRLMRKEGYVLVYLADDGVKSVAGLRIGEWLPQGRYLEIEDLVTAAASRSRGYGRVLLDWLFEYAAERRCRHVRLTSAVRRGDAHRFYERQGMVREAYYYSIDVPRA